jgi:hypothetical protein
MKKLFFAIFSLAFVSAHAQADPAAVSTVTADEIVQKNAAAMGGLENFYKIKTVKFTGTVNTQGMDLPLTMQVVNGKAMRSDIDVMGQSITSVYKDEKGWKINPVSGITTATDVSGSELNDLKSQSNLANQLMDYKKRGAKIELLGQEDVEGIKTYKIKYIADDSRETTYFINVKDFILIKTVTSREMMGQQMDVETFYSDLKEFGAVKFFMNRAQKVQGQVVFETKIDKVELDVAVDDNIFTKK